MIAVLAAVSGYHLPQRPDQLRRTPVSLPQRSGPLRWPRVEPASHADGAAVVQAKCMSSTLKRDTAPQSNLLLVSTAVGLGFACSAVPDITTVQMSFFSWTTVAVALPVAALWLVPFFAATDFIEASDALASGLRVATSARKVNLALPSTTFVDTLTAFAEGTAVKLAASRAKMALAAELHEEESMVQSTLPSQDTFFTIDSTHEGMACVEFYSEDDGQLQWVCV